MTSVSVTAAARSSALASFSPNQPVVVWFRDDLRLADNPALAFAAALGRPVFAVFIREEPVADLRPLGGAAKWWLGKSLLALESSLSAKGGQLNVFAGLAEDIIAHLVADIRPAAVVWNRRYTAAEQAVDARVKTLLKNAGVHAQSFNSHLLKEPWEVKSKSGGAMKVFTPYWRAARELGEPPLPLAAPLEIAAVDWPASATVRPVGIASLQLSPTQPNWAAEMERSWTPGETGARQALGAFLDSAAQGYGENRNRPDRRSTSRLSPHLRFGEIGPRQIWHATRAAFEAGQTPAKTYDIEKFLAEIGWREFSYHLLGQFPALAKTNFQARFDAFPWANDPKGLKAWKKGLTGYPIVDAGMRELWRTGWMHNRVRMITASFLIKHLLIDWREGENWFWDTLVDADPASNAASWQWVAGSGADAAPYFRIFAPVLQGEKFDPNGAYIRTYVPELAKLPKAFIHKPWTAPHPVLAQAGITLGTTYPHPIVVHEAARARALDAFKRISSPVAE